jgi:hypothetical protein
MVSMTSQSPQPAPPSQDHQVGCCVSLFVLLFSFIVVMTALFPLVSADILPAPGKEADEAGKLLTIFNAALILVASLAGLSFAYAQAVPDRASVRQLAVRAGELNTLGALALLFGCTLRYAVLLKLVAWDFARAVFPITAVVLFVVGVIFSHVGVGFLVNGIFTSWWGKQDK